MTFKATYDNVVVEPLDEEAVSSGGIVLTGSIEKTFNRGKVLFVGDGRKNKNGDIVPLIIKVGDVVAYPLEAGTKITIDGEHRVILKEEQIFATVDE